MKKRTKKLTGFMLFAALMLACPVQAQVTIGSGREPDPSAALDLESNGTLGLFLPRVGLTSTSSFIPLGGEQDHKAGMMVYNIATNGDVTPGTYYNDGKKWIRLGLLSGNTGRAQLLCERASFDPGQVLKMGTDIPAGVVIKVPYLNGNGGVYNGATISSNDTINGSTITAKIESGVLAQGAGELIFTVQPGSHPSATEALTGTATFLNLQPFLDANPIIDSVSLCKEIKIGYELKAEIISVATIDNLRAVEDLGVKGFACQLTTPDGKFTVRAHILDHDEHPDISYPIGDDHEYAMNLQIRNNTDDEIVISGQYTYDWSGSSGSGQTFLSLKPHVWSGDNDQTPSLDPNINGTTATPATNYASYLSDSAKDPKETNGTHSVSPIGYTSTKEGRQCGNIIHWGNPGVYASSVPERRTYSWGVNDGAKTKTAYILTFSSTSMTPTKLANSVTCPNGVCLGTQVFMLIQEINAYSGEQCQDCSVDQ